MNDARLVANLLQSHGFRGRVVHGAIFPAFVRTYSTLSQTHELLSEAERVTRMSRLVRWQGEQILGRDVIP